jgi:hypothetical protein
LTLNQRNAPTTGNETAKAYFANQRDDELRYNRVLWLIAQRRSGERSSPVAGELTKLRKRSG